MQMEIKSEEWKYNDIVVGNEQKHRTKTGNQINAVA